MTINYPADTQLPGLRKLWKEAFGDGDVFLDTVDRLLVSPAAVSMLYELGEYLRPGCNVCVEMGKVELDSVGAYLNVHEPCVTLQDHRAGLMALPVLYVVDGRMCLEQ